MFVMRHTLDLRVEGDCHARIMFQHARSVNKKAIKDNGPVKGEAGGTGVPPVFPWHRRDACATKT